MKNPGVSSRTAWKRLLLVGVVVVVAWSLTLWIREVSKQDELIAVDLSGKQHIGPNFSIAPFFLNGTNGFNVSRDGGGGSDVCCVLLPKIWRPGLLVDLRWAVANWSSENVKKAIDDGQKEISFKCFRAKVPVEKYETPERVVVHFFCRRKGPRGSRFARTR